MQVQGELVFKQRGGKREGAGRKRVRGSRFVMHRPREHVTRHTPVHTTLRVVRGVGRLRQGKVLGAIEKAALAVEAREDFRLVHVSIQSNHLHFLVEAEDRYAMSRGMQALAIVAARAINRVMKRKGRVFQYRFAAKVIREPRYARSALAYVLNNWRRHREDEGKLASRDAVLDPYSSASSFDGWKSVDLDALPSWYMRFSVRPPRSWLLTTAWRKGGPLDPWATPAHPKTKSHPPPSGVRAPTSSPAPRS